MALSYSIQLFSLADLAQKEGLGSALRAVAGLGYKQVEFAGFYGCSASQVRQYLDDNSLSVSSAHVPLAEIRDNFAHTVQFHKTIGNNCLIMPMEDLNCQAKLDRFETDVRAVKALLEAEGLCLGYHNHLHEFHPNLDGSQIYEQMLNRSDVFLEVDVGWVNAAGCKALQLIERVKERIRFLHIRDSVPYQGPVSGVPMPQLYDDVFKSGVGQPLGRGTAPIEEAWLLSRQNGWHMVVESEAKCPDGVATMGICMDYLRSLEQKHPSFRQ